MTDSSEEEYSIFLEMKSGLNIHFVFSRAKSPNLFTILKDFRDAPFYIHCLFHMIDLMMFSLSCKMDHDLP